jgi:hypothetical protein
MRGYEVVLFGVLELDILLFPGGFFLSFLFPRPPGLPALMWPMKFSAVTPAAINSSTKSLALSTSSKPCSPALLQP